MQTDPLVRPTTPMVQTELMADVVACLMDVLGDAESLAVRSSSTEEDSGSASFAGQHSTYYFVPPQRLDQAIVDCWMSLWSDAAVSYRRSGWGEISSAEPVRMAVIVQRMLPATRSGVAFSRDPITRVTTGESSDCVIEATWGLGAALVDGRVNPDHIRVDEGGSLVSYQISEKHLQVHANSYDARLQELPQAQRNAAVINDQEAERIANIAQQLETLFDAPQDVEWAYVDDTLYLLQTRPITTLPSQHDFDDQLVLFKPLAENFTEPLTPLTADILGELLPKIGALYEGRFYIDINTLRQLAPFELADHELAQAALLRSSSAMPKWSWLGILRSALKLGVAFLCDGANWLRTARVSEPAFAKYRDVVKRVIADETMDARAAARKLIWGSHPFEPIGNQAFYTNISAGRYFIYLGVLHRLVARFAPDYDTTNLALTYHGREDMQSLALLTRMVELGQLLRATEQGINSASEQANEQVLSVVQGKTAILPHGHPFTEKFDAFVNEYGHRGPRELELAAPRWRESPAALLNLIASQQARDTQSGTHRDDATNQALAANDPHGHEGGNDANNIEARQGRTHGAHLAARDELHSYLTPLQRKIVDRVLSKISYFVALRENTRHYHVMAFDTVRQKLLLTEQSLIRDGKLRIESDIFFLLWREVTALTNGELEPRLAHTRIRQRRRSWQRAARNGAAETINIDMSPVDPPLADADGETANGQCASPGSTRGRARILLSLNDSDQLEEGEILIAPYTDPAWTPLFSRAAGVVVETGSFLSHAGTVARELHIPCLVDVKGCTRDFRSGQWVELDASRGLLREVSPA